MKNIILLFSVVAFGFATQARASVIIDVTQVGSDVDFSATGSLDLAGATAALEGAGYGVGLISGGSNWYVAPGPGGSYDSYALTSSDGAFGTSTNFDTPPSSESGDNFFIWGDGGFEPQVGVTGGYISGDAISSGMVFDNTTIADLFLTPGLYHYAITNDTITLNIEGISTVPDSGATIALLGIALAGIAAARRKFV